MSALRQAAQMALEALESGLAFSTHSPVLQNLRAALAEEALQRLTDVQQEIQAAPAQPEQERITHITWDERGVRTVNGIPDDAPQRQWVGLIEQDMPSGEDPMFDHQYFIAGLVYADKVLKEKNSG